MELSAQIQQFANKTEERLNQIVRASCLELFSKIVQRTPVDTGRARANWQIELDGVSGNSTVNFSGEKGRAKDRNKDVDKPRVERNKARATAVAIENGENAMARLNTDTKMVCIYNNLDYIIPLEYDGISQQAPAGMARISLMEFPKIVASLSQTKQ